MTHDINDIKQKWQQLDALHQQTPRSSAVPFTSQAAVKVVSRQEKLLRHYRVNIIVGSLFIVLGPLNFALLDFPLWAKVSVSLYFAIMAALSFNMYSKVNHLDLANTPTVSLLEQVESIYSSLNLFTIIGIGLCIPLLSMILFYLKSNEAAFIGGICGAILGSLIGYIKSSQIRRYIKEIRRELANALDEPAM